MRAYRIKIILKDSKHPIWRRVIIPAGISFKSLHQVIQSSMGWNDNYIYDFDIEEEKLRITNDEEALREYKYYSSKKLTNKNDPHGFIEKMLQITPKLSHHVMIDEYLSKYKKLNYVYDLGDYWKHEIILEQELNNYYSEYPECIEGEGACPPEDVGGTEGYELFLEAINDKTNPEHNTMKSLAETKGYTYAFEIEKANKLISRTI